MEIEFVVSWTEDIYGGYDAKGNSLYNQEPHEFFSDNLLDVLGHERPLRERIHHMEVNRHGRMITKNIVIKARIKE